MPSQLYSALRFIPELNTSFTSVENVETDLRFDPKLLLHQKVPVDLVLVQQQAEGWSNRNAGKDRKTQTVFGDVTKSSVERRILAKVHKQEIAGQRDWINATSALSFSRIVHSTSNFKYSVLLEDCVSFSEKVYGRL